jgi:glycosyltransferase involved in cell wall biosynthesis
MTITARRVTILMALYNGAPHLQAQLDSFAAQDWADWDLLVSDDGSGDAGPEIVRAFAAAQPKRAVRLISGPKQGFARNFLHLIAEAGDGSAVAIADQDDVWLPAKLSRAMAVLADHAQDQPLLYCARTHIVAPDLTPLALSPRWPRPFGFANALVQNVAAGNTIVLNRAALHLAQEAGRRAAAAGAADVAAHDWWLYQLVTGAGGLVVRDDAPVLLYRQHPQNEMGRNDTLSAWRARLAKVMSGTFADWNRRNIAALTAAGDLLTPEARHLLADFARLRQRGLFGRLAGLRRAGLYRQTRGAQAVLWLAAALGRI